MNDPDVLYHYTTAAGLIGIAEAKALWGTDAEFLNDAQELRLGRAELRQALLEKADELSPPGSSETVAGGPDESRATVMRSVADHLEPGGLYLRKPAHSAYVVCFCEDGDLLGQWRAYGAPGGYAIGFRVLHLRQIRSLYIGPPVKERTRRLTQRLWRPATVEWGPSLPVDLVQVRYGRPAVEAVVGDIMREVAPQPTGHPGVIGFFRAQSLVFPALAGIKHEAFREEREWRLIVVGSIGHEHVAFRSGPLGVIPFIQLAFPPEAIAEVVVGPGREQDVRQRGAERLLAEHMPREVEVVVRPSAAPFRG